MSSFYLCNSLVIVSIYHINLAFMHKRFLYATDKDSNSDDEY